MKTYVLTEDGAITMLIFWCPGCDTAHGVHVVKGMHVWHWNGDREKPTLSPSIVSEGHNRCHMFLRDGVIEFLKDSSHKLAGQKVDLPDFDAALNG